MTFISSEEVEKALRRDGLKKVLAKYGRYRIAPGFTVADYVKIGEFYLTAGDYLANESRPVSLQVAAAR